jgi:polysaccharide deacetylase family protein (PEP-CTERM system associated)
VVDVPTTPPVILLTIDMEDWYDLASELLGGTPRLRPDILARQLDRVLELLARHRRRATFFCLGRSLAGCPELVQRVAQAGHELGTHGWSHQRLFRTGLKAFREDLRRAVGWLRDLTGQPVWGHRAPAFSVLPEQLEEFYDICLEAGLVYDSSVFPFRGRRYGIPDAPRGPHVVRNVGGRKLIEMPLATVDWLGRRWALAGGGWWRLLPLGVIRRGIERVGREGLPFMTYFHPSEFDAQRLDAVVAAGRSSARAWKVGWQQNLFRSAVYRKLDTVLSEHRSCAVEDYLREHQYA